MTKQYDKIGLVKDSGKKARMWQIVKDIPKGKVVSYGQLAREVGVHPRVIGRWLHQNDSPGEYPCHRVIKSDRTIASGYAFGGEGMQRQLLEDEGVIFDKRGKVSGKQVFCDIQPV